MTQTFVDAAVVAAVAVGSEISAAAAVAVTVGAETAETVFFAVAVAPAVLDLAAPRRALHLFS